MKNIITIIIPCYNHGDTICETLDSILDQTYKDWSCIVVNDGSTDNTSDVVNEYMKKDNRISLINQENSGPSAARNRGVQEADSKYIAFLDADDKYLPNYLEHALNYMENHPECRVYSCRTQTFGAFSEEWDWLYSGYRNLLRWNSIDCCSVVKRADFLETGGFDETMCGYEDWEFFIRLLYKHDNVFQEKETLYLHRIGENENSVNIQAMSKKKEISTYIYCKHISKYCEYFGYPQDLMAELDDLKLWKKHKIIVLADSLMKFCQKAKSLLFGKFIKIK